MLGNLKKQNNDGFVVDSPPKIMIQFDQIAYARGGSILKMMQHVMTEETWVDGMRQYMGWFLICSLVFKMDQSETS